MALSTATITYDVSDQVGTDFDIRRTKVWVSTNIADGTVIDTVGNAIRVDTGQGTLAADGTGSVTVWTPGTGSNPDSWQTYVHLDYASPMDRTRKRRTFGPFTVTTSANLADLVEEQEVPAEYLTTVTAALQVYVDDAEASEAAAEAAEVAAEAAQAAAEAARDDAIDISGIATPDAVVEALVNDSASLTTGALLDTLATMAVQYVTLNGNDSNHGRSWGQAKLTVAAAVTALRAVGGGIIELGMGAYTVSATINLTNLTNITIEGRGSSYSTLVLNTGPIGIDLTGTARWRMRRLQLYTIGQVSPATVGLLLGRSTTNGTVEFSHIEDVWFNMHHDAAANGGKGTIGIYNNTAEIAAATDTLVISADRPYVATMNNIYSITSALTTTATLTSMSVVEFNGSPTLISLGGPAITLDNAANFCFRGYINRGSGSSAYAIEVLSLCSDVEIRASIEGFTRALKTIARIDNLQLVGRINPGAGDLLVLLDGSTGGTPGITGGRIDLAPPTSSTNAHVLIDDGTGANQLGIYDLDIHLYLYQSIDAPAVIASGCTIRCDANTPTSNLATSWGSNVVLTRTYTEASGPLRLISGQPTFAAGANNGASPPTPNTASANANRGDINFGSGTGPAAGAQVAVTFAAAYATAPKVVVGAANAATAALNLYATATTGGFTISSVNAPAASQSNGTFVANYVVVG